MLTIAPTTVTTAPGATLTTAPATGKTALNETVQNCVSFCLCTKETKSFSYQLGQKREVGLKYFLLSFIPSTSLIITHHRLSKPIIYLMRREQGNTQELKENRFAPLDQIYLFADPGKARGCYTNTVVIKWWNKYLSKTFYIFNAHFPKCFFFAYRL